MDETPTTIFNPTRSSFTHTYDISGKGVPVPFTIESLKYATFGKTIADHLAKHLRNKIIGEMPGIITDSVMDKVTKEIYGYDTE